MVPPGVRKLETTLKGNSTLRKKQSLRVVPLALCGRSVERAKSVHGSQSESGQSLKKPSEYGLQAPCSGRALRRSASDGSLSCTRGRDDGCPMRARREEPTGWGSRFV